MINLDSPTTLSGIFVFLSVLAYFGGRHLLASILLIITGSAGLGIVWDRWSERGGHQTQITAFFSPHSPNENEVALFGTHLPLLIVGLAVLFMLHRKRSLDTGIHETDVESKRQGRSTSNVQDP